MRSSADLNYVLAGHKYDSVSGPMGMGVLGGRGLPADVGSSYRTVREELHASTAANRPGVDVHRKGAIFTVSGTGRVWCAWNCNTVLKDLASNKTVEHAGSNQAGPFHSTRGTRSQSTDRGSEASRL